MQVYFLFCICKNIQKGVEKQSHHMVLLVALLELSIISHEQMEFAQLSWNCTCSHFYFFQVFFLFFLGLTHQCWLWSWGSKFILELGNRSWEKNTTATKWTWDCFLHCCFQEWTLNLWVSANMHKKILKGLRKNTKQKQLNRNVTTSVTPWQLHNFICW